MKAAIIDYGLGNLFSISQSCRRAGIEAQLVHEATELEKHDIMILPGVGAFGDAMAALQRLDLVAPIRDFAASGRPVMGVCLGLQLMMTESHEFGTHRGLDLVSGTVDHLEPGSTEAGRPYKVPSVGWNRVSRPEGSDAGIWKDTYLSEMQDGEFQYFVHSYAVRPENSGDVLSVSRYGNIEYCSSIQRGNLFACQFHPERSGPAGQAVYEALARKAGIAG